MTPAPGRIVLYTLTEQDAAAINSRREDARANARIAAKSAAELDPHPGGAFRTGHVAHVGNDVAAGDVFPAVMVRVWNERPGTVNLKVMLDGTDELWATSVVPGEGPRQYQWPPRV